MTVAGAGDAAEAGAAGVVAAGAEDDADGAGAAAAGAGALETAYTTIGMNAWSLPHSSAHWPR